MQTKEMTDTVELHAEKKCCVGKVSTDLYLNLILLFILFYRSLFAEIDYSVFKTDGPNFQLLLLLLFLLLLLLMLFLLLLLVFVFGLLVLVVVEVVMVALLSDGAMKFQVALPSKFAVAPSTATVWPTKTSACVDCALFSMLTSDAN